MSKCDGKFYTAEQSSFIEQRKASCLTYARRLLRLMLAVNGDFDEVIDEVREKYSLDGDALDTYDKLLSDPKFEIVKNLVPDFGVELVELFGLLAEVKPNKKRHQAQSTKEKREAVSPTGSSSRPDSSAIF